MKVEMLIFVDVRLAKKTGLCIVTEYEPGIYLSDV
jgi:hypothetical protein